MKPTHILQIVLACIVAGGGAAVPLFVSPMTATQWILLAVAEAAAIGKVLSVQSEVAGDKAPSNVVEKSASKIAPLAMLCMVLGVTQVGCQNGQLSPQFVEVSTASLNLLACGLNTYAQNTTTSPINWGTVALDLATNCGMDLVDIVNLFGQSSPVAQAAASNPAAIHAAAMAFKAKNPNGPAK